MNRRDFLRSGFLSALMAALVPAWLVALAGRSQHEELVIVGSAAASSGVSFEEANAAVAAMTRLTRSAQELARAFDEYSRCCRDAARQSEALIMTLRCA